jgi:hypothetical protein
MAPVSTINFLSNEDTSGLAPRFFISFRDAWGMISYLECILEKVDSFPKIP